MQKALLTYTPPPFCLLFTKNILQLFFYACLQADIKLPSCPQLVCLCCRQLWIARATFRSRISRCLPNWFPFPLSHHLHTLRVQYLLHKVHRHRLPQPNYCCRGLLARSAATVRTLGARQGAHSQDQVPRFVHDKPGTMLPDYIEFTSTRRTNCPSNDRPQEHSTTGVRFMLCKV